MRTTARCRWRFNQRRRAVTRTQLGVKIFAALNLKCGAPHFRFVVMMVECWRALFHQLEEDVRLLGF
jgi:hypothetical protein